MRNVGASRIAFKRLGEEQDILEDVIGSVEWDRLRVCIVDWLCFSKDGLMIR
jgi:hypothetical protein